MIMLVLCDLQEEACACADVSVYMCVSVVSVSGCVCFVRRFLQSFCYVYVCIYIYIFVSMSARECVRVPECFGHTSFFD